MNIYVSNLGDQITEASLHAAFSTHGEVSSAKIILDQFTGYPRGFGFVEMPDEAQATEAISKIDGAVINGRQISAKEAKPKETHKGSYPVRSGYRK
ncbi:MAG TPA: RNA-binding protein [Flavisolibacter sp.]|jgi:RNA recognition motif-containing protein|nr:RNA-binding protein [Flavisolibacter sp.]